MIVLKFGGTSVGSAANIKKLIAIAESRKAQQPVVIVVSAMGGTTDTLIEAGQKAATGDDGYKTIIRQIEDRHFTAVRELSPVQKQSGPISLIKKLCNELEDICDGVFLLNELSPRTRDRIISFGEIISAQMIALAFEAAGESATYKDARELIRTNSNYGFAAVDFSATQELISTYFQNHPSELFIVPGFVATNDQGSTTTLGRGGSDYTAAILAAALESSTLEIWTDVSGMLTADPRLAPNARPIPFISYQEAMELSHFGAKVIYPPTIQPVLSKNIPIVIKNSFAPEDPGTVISHLAAGDGNSMVRGISSIDNIALLSLEGSGMVGIPGFSRRLFEALSNAGINVILITQSSSEHSICVGVDTASADKAKDVVDECFAYEISVKKLEPLGVEKELSILALVGDNMKNHTGVSGRLFSALGRNGVNIRAIAQGSSERNISTVINTRDVRKAVNVLHEVFFETEARQINLFIAGTGNVGSKLFRQLEQQMEYLFREKRLQIRVAGIINSRKMLLNMDGIPPADWENLPDSTPVANPEAFAQGIIQANLRNTVFADVTGSEAIAAIYASLLKKSVSVVACNKIAASSEYVHYKKLRELAREFNCRFLFETNVGAGLPIIGTLNDLLNSGDEVNEIRAVLSGTLNYVFNHYNGEKTFAEIVRQAQAEGYTEPDPRLDLSGADVMRKILILAREAGTGLEMSDIQCDSFLPPSCMEGSVEDFYTEMEKHEAHFRALYEAAKSKGNKLKFMASFIRGKADVGLREVDPGHDFYHLYGKDNIVLFYTRRYSPQPLVIKGAGAGADVTASGVFADIMRAV